MLNATKNCKSLANFFANGINLVPPDIICHQSKNIIVTALLLAICKNEMKTIWTCDVKIQQGQYKFGNIGSPERQWLVTGGA